MNNLTSLVPQSVLELPPKYLEFLVLQEKQARYKANKLAYYRPYTKQKDFHAAGRHFRERLLMAGNQVGKTLAGGNEFAMHATCEYPKWWEGRIWNRPIMSWAAGVTSELTRDGVQRFLLGRPNEIGTGTIPRWRIRDYTMKRGVADAIDTVQVRWGGGGDVSVGDSIIQFKSYDQGRQKFQQESLDLAWLDEEPEYEIYSETLTRTNATGGAVFMTFTPLEGMTQTVMRFVTEKSPGTHVTMMTIDDAGHFTPEQRAMIISSYPEHERDARTKGIPMLGSGRVYPVIEASITIQPIDLPKHWPRLAALDFGYDHPTAIAWLAWDRDTDTVYVYDCYRLREALVPIHSAVLIGRGQWIPVAWPHDGLNDTAVGPQLAQQYRDAGVNMLAEHAQYDVIDGGTPENTKSSRTSVEAGVSDILTRMRSGRFKVFNHLNDWFEEFRMYHRKDGKIVKLADDLMCATRYGIMSLRYAAEPKVASVNRADRGGNWRVL